MKATVTSIKSGDVLEYDVAQYHYLSDQSEFALQLRGRPLKSVPKKTLYKVEIYDDKGNEVQVFDTCLLKNYSVAVDESRVINGDVVMEQAPVVNNSLGFILIE